MKRTTIRKPEDLPPCLKRRLVFGNAEQINALGKTIIKIPDNLPILQKHVEIEVKK
jgi:hypothetical protein